MTVRRLNAGKVGKLPAEAGGDVHEGEKLI